MRASVHIAVLALVATGCSAARHTGPPILPIPERVGHVTVVIEPLFEQAKVVERDVTQTATAMPGTGYYPGQFGTYGPQPVTIVQRVEEKPLLARPHVLAQLQSLVISEVKRRRPDWEVVSTAALAQKQEGQLSLVRTIVGDSEIVGSNRTLRTLSFWFGFVCPPLFYFAAQPVSEAQRVYGSLFRFDADAGALQNKLIRYPTQPDFAVDTRGLAHHDQPFGLDIEYEEGIFASDRPRDAVLIEGFAEQLANAVIALVEGV